MNRYGRNQKRQHRQRIAELESLAFGPWRRGTTEPTLESLGFEVAEERIAEEKPKVGFYDRNVVLEGTCRRSYMKLVEHWHEFRLVQWKGICYQIVDVSAQTRYGDSLSVPMLKVSMRALA